jgi:hypothetical protein
MNIMIFYVIAASMFSLDGIGEDNGIFKDPFLNIESKARLEISLRPEFSILNEGSDYRGIFWTNPFHLKFAVPITHGFVFGAGNKTRFTQSFDLYYDQDDLTIHLDGKGGIEELFVNLNNDFGFGEIALQGSYLLGNASEIWDYSIGNSSLVDSFEYQYEGKIFGGGIKLRAKELFDISLSGEAFGDINMEHDDMDSLIDLPNRVSVTIMPKVKVLGGFLFLTAERSFWPDNGLAYRSPYRLKTGLVKDRISVDYYFNPWYLDGISEHGMDLSISLPITRIGTLCLDLGGSFKYKGSLREFRISPDIKLVLSELFAKRRR